MKMMNGIIATTASITGPSGARSETNFARLLLYFNTSRPACELQILNPTDYVHGALRNFTFRAAFES